MTEDYAEKFEDQAKAFATLNKIIKSENTHITSEKAMDLITAGMADVCRMLAAIAREEAE